MRAPFDAFEVHLVAEYADPGGDNYMEQVNTPEELEDAREEALGFIYTVYGWREPPEDGEFKKGHGHTAISDFDEDNRQAAIDLAYALADGKPVHDFSLDIERRSQ